VRSVLEGRGLEVCGEAADGQEALAKVLQLRPDLVILDITMPVLDGFSAAREIHKRLPGVGILLLSMHESASMVNVAKSSGARGYVAKSEGIARILKAVDAIAHNKTFFPNLQTSLRTSSRRLLRLSAFSCLLFTALASTYLLRNEGVYLIVRIRRSFRVVVQGAGPLFIPSLAKPNRQ